MIKFTSKYRNEYKDLFSEYSNCKTSKPCDGEIIVQKENYSFRSNIGNTSRSLYPIFSDRTRNKEERFANKLVYKDE